MEDHDYETDGRREPLLTPRLVLIAGLAAIAGAAGGCLLGQTAGPGDAQPDAGACRCGEHLNWSGVQPSGNEMAPSPRPAR